MPEIVKPELRQLGEFLFITFGEHPGGWSEFLPGVIGIYVDAEVFEANWMERELAQLIDMTISNYYRVI